MLRLFINGPLPLAERLVSHILTFCLLTEAKDHSSEKNIFARYSDILQGDFGRVKQIQVA